jgi:hypothetical protein
MEDRIGNLDGREVRVHTFLDKINKRLDVLIADCEGD